MILYLIRDARDLLYFRHIVNPYDVRTPKDRCRHSHRSAK